MRYELLLVILCVFLFFICVFLSLADWWLETLRLFHLIRDHLKNDNHICSNALFIR